MAGAVEYTDCFSAEKYTPNECPVYDTKQTNRKAPILRKL